MIHAPKYISSIDGLGLNTEKEMEFISDVCGIGIEKWGPLREVWAEGDVVIAREGYVWRTKWEVNKPYIITQFCDADSQLVGVYCDVCRPVMRMANGFTFVDLYLDVWHVPGRKPVILDEDELAAAISAGFVTQDEANRAMTTANFLVAELGRGKLLDF